MSQSIEEQMVDLPLAEKRALLAELLRQDESKVDISPLSFAQQRLWFLSQLEPDSASYNLPLALRLKGELDIKALEQTLNHIIARHETLRTTFKTLDGEPVQIVSSVYELDLTLTNLEGLPEAEREAEAQRLANAEVQRPFDLGRDYPLRAGLLRINHDHHWLLLTMHHIASDGWSVGILKRELAKIYGAITTNQPIEVPELPVQYADFAEWQREWLQGEVLERKLDYWKQQLKDAPRLLELPLDWPRPAIQTHRGGRERLVLPESLARALRTLSRQEGATLFMTLLAVFQLLLSRYSGQADISVGSPIAGRTHPEVEGLIGFFINTMVLRTRFPGDPTFRELLARVREVALGAFSHQEIPFEKLVEELQPERNLSHPPIFQVFFNMQTANSANRIELPGLTVEHLPYSGIGSKFDLTLYVFEDRDEMKLSLLYNADLFKPERMVEMLEQFKYLLEQIVEDPDKRIDQFSLVTPGAKAVLPDPTQIFEASWQGSIQRLISQRACQTPDHQAVVDQDGNWSYGELDARSNQLANYLQAKDIRSQDIVAVYAHRSASLVPALLGVLKAGAAFLILDPAYPVSRLIHYLQIARPRGWLQIAGEQPVPRELSDFVDTLGCRMRLELPRSTHDDWVALSGYSKSDPNVVVKPEDPAYVAFTSGSTGIPKGILGRHETIPHFGNWASREFNVSSADRFSMLSGLSHDPLHRDIFTALQLGATICIPDAADLGNPDGLATWMTLQKISIANLTPAMSQLLSETTNSSHEIHSLRYAFIVGDVLTKRDVARLRKLAPSLTCINLYGATETHFALAYFEVPATTATSTHDDGNSPGQKEVLPLGKGIVDVQLILLNASNAMAGIGEVGEICFRSPHLTAGYLGDDVLTHERFVLNPFTNAFGDRIYRTGDLGRYLPDGNVEFVGRLDGQVKLRGFRVEPGEIEANLMRHPQITQAAVVVREGTSGERKLVAYVVAQGDTVRLGRELRKFLKEYLPEYMVPASFVLVDQLPLTPSGKINRLALLTMKGEERETTELYVAPRTPVEQKLAEIWSAILHRERIGIHDNFFDLGGHSMLAVKLMADIEKAFGQRIPLVSLFQGSTIEYLTGLLKQDVASMSWPTLIEIQAGDSTAPLFCVSHPNVNALGYRTLARYLGPTQSVFGLQAQYPEDLDGEYSREVVDKLATEYLETLRTVRPTGPYQFIGLCRGAHVAYEMARRLEQEGQQVAFVGILDTWVMENTYNIFFFIDHYLNRLRGLTKLGLKNQLSLVRRKAQGALTNLGGKNPTDGSDNGGKRKKKNPLHEVYFPGPDFVPRTYNGRVTVFRARRQPRQRIRDFSLGWGRLALGGTDVHIISGAHISVLKEPFVQSLATELKKCLLDRES